MYFHSYDKVDNSLSWPNRYLPKLLRTVLRRRVKSVYVALSENHAKDYEVRFESLLLVEAAELLPYKRACFAGVCWSASHTQCLFPIGRRISPPGLPEIISVVSPKWTNLKKDCLAFLHCCNAFLLFYWKATILNSKPAWQYFVVARLSEKEHSNRNIFIVLATTTSALLTGSPLTLLCNPHSLYSTAVTPLSSSNYLSFTFYYSLDFGVLYLVHLYLHLLSPL